MILISVSACSSQPSEPDPRVEAMLGGFEQPEQELIVEMATELPGFEIQAVKPMKKVKPAGPPPPGMTVVPPRDPSAEKKLEEGTARVAIASDLEVSDDFKESIIELDLLRPITNLRLRSDRMGDEDLDFLGELSEVDFLSLQCPKISDQLLEEIAQMKNLVELRFENCPITDAGLARLSGLERLHILWLKNTEVTGSGFAELTNLKTLQFVVLSGSPVDDDGLLAISGMPSIMSLQLDGTDVTDRGLKHVPNMKNLFLLNVEGTEVTNRGAGELRLRNKKLQLLY